jgi:TonB family protein
MKKILLTILIAQFSIASVFSQTSLNEHLNQIDKFIEATTIIPYMASVANVQDKVIVKIIIDDKKSFQYEIIKGFRTDCNNEALRVCKLINVNNLLKVIDGKSSIEITIPFHTKEKVIYENEVETLLYNEKSEKCYNIGDAKYQFQYEVDTLTGLPVSKVEILELKNGKIKSKEVVDVKIDSSKKYMNYAFDKKNDSLKVISYSFGTQMGVISWDLFSNHKHMFIQRSNRLRSFYPSGRIREEALSFLDKDVVKTITTNWFPNGQIAYKEETSGATNSLVKDVVKIASWDTLGNTLVHEKNGEDVNFEGGFPNWLCNKGTIKNGHKVGKWIGISHDGKTEYIEFYKDGVLEKGISYAENDSTQYNSLEEMANFESGLSGFGNFLQNNLRYPKDAQRANRQGKVYVQFVVCTDGTLCDFEVLKGVGYGCDEEAVRVLELSSGKWKPGKQRGKEVRSRFTIPINYRLR